MFFFYLKIDKLNFINTILNLLLLFILFYTHFQQIFLYIHSYNFIYTHIHTKGFISKPSFVLEENNLFLPKEKAVSFLQVRSKRVKRDIDEECRETEGCWFEEILEYGVTDVVTILSRYVLLKVLHTFRKRFAFKPEFLIP